MPIGTPKVMRLAVFAAAILLSACAPLATPSPTATPRPEQVLVRPNHAIAAGGGNLIGPAGGNVLPAPAPGSQLGAPPSASAVLPVIDTVVAAVGGTTAPPVAGQAIAIGGGNVGVAIDPNATLIGQSGNNISAPSIAGPTSPDGLNFERVATQAVSVEK